jgi:membrane-bound serine protease (ClpP class)
MAMPCVDSTDETDWLYNESASNGGAVEFFLNPNIAYLLLMAGTFLTLMAIVIPGTGMPEIGAVFCLVLAGYAVYHLSFTWWALALMIVSMVPFFFSLRKPYSGRFGDAQHKLWLGLSIFGLTLGSVFFFPSESGPISVNPILAILASTFYAVFVWLAVRKSVQAAQAKPAHDMSTLIGQRGEAKTIVKEDGSVQVAGELWSARSNQSIPVGSVIRVIDRDGFVLIVEQDRV